MRLLHTTERKLEEFIGDEIPLYAILSHTWGEKEITFQDFEGHDAEEKEGYEKIRNTCNIAAAHGFDYVWIDTCCIDKKSSVELSEAINSMYRWYQDSIVCYVYLADVPPSAVDHQTGVTGPKFSESRWFKRGWTLQELIAPSTIIVLDQKWQEVGTKSSLKHAISNITGIPTDVLLSGDLDSSSIAQKMSWASARETTRVEDLAYCLMGIFGINMPLLYGEGKRAFTRLQEEIVKISDDHSLFAWKSYMKQSGLLATSPAAFSESSKIISSNSSDTSSGVITVNNKGIHLKLQFNTDNELAILPCMDNGKKVAICLRAMSERGEYFIRVRCSDLRLLDLRESSPQEYHEKSICVQQERPMRKNQSSLPRAAANGHETLVKMLLDKGAELESKSDNGQTPLSWAAEKGHDMVVKLLLDKGAELETRDGIYGQTPLSWAARKGHGMVVKLLLDKGAELETRDGIYGQTPLSWAAGSGYDMVVKLLLDKGAELETRDGDFGQTPLSWAAEKGHDMVVKLLLDKGAELETRDGIYGQTPLSLAAEKGYEAVVKLLLDKGAELETRDAAYGRTPLSLAASKGHEMIVKLLLERGAEPESTDNRGRTPLSWATEKGNEAVVKLLQDRGSDPESKSASG